MSIKILKIFLFCLPTYCYTVNDDKDIVLFDSKSIRSIEEKNSSFILLPDPKFYLDENLYKVKTYQLLASLGCPVMPSALLMTRIALTDESLKKIQTHLNDDSCSLRLQYKNPCSNPIRGGKKVSLVKEELEKFWSDKYILWPVAHVDRIKNLYGINILYRPAQKRIFFEILGKGFDGTDLNKGDLSPHQIIELNIPNERGVYNDLWHNADVYIVSSSLYKESIKVRRNKLIFLEIDPEEIKIPEIFTPLGLSQLKKLDAFACKVFEHFNYEQEINISATILDNGQIIFWDYQTPDNKSAAFFGDRYFGK